VNGCVNDGVPRAVRHRRGTPSLTQHSFLSTLTLHNKEKTKHTVRTVPAHTLEVRHIRPRWVPCCRLPLAGKAGVPCQCLTAHGTPALPARGGNTPIDIRTNTIEPHGHTTHTHAHARERQPWKKPVEARNRHGRGNDPRSSVEALYGHERWQKRPIPNDTHDTPHKLQAF